MQFWKQINTSRPVIWQSRGQESRFWSVLLHHDGSHGGLLLTTQCISRIPWVRSLGQAFAKSAHHHAQQ
jgi:hypothetical protein